MCSKENVDAHYYPPESKLLTNGYVGRCGKLPADQMVCPECWRVATSESVDVGVGLIVRGNFECACGWEYDADGKLNVATYDDYFVEKV